MKKSIFILFVFCAICLTNISAQSAYKYADSSKLSTGTWVKLRISKDGIYKLTYNDLVSMGIKNPQRAKIYGYGGRALDPLFSNSFPDDLPQVAIWQEKGSDGIFGSGDYILFYGRGTVKWEYSGSEYVHSNNPYSTYGYYFVSDNDQEEIKTISQRNSSSASPDVTIDTYDFYDVWETELYNYLYSGTEFYGEAFTRNQTRNFNFSVPGITSDPGKIRVEMAACAESGYPAYCVVKLDGTEVSRQRFTAATGKYVVRNAEANILWTGDKKTNTTISVTYEKESTRAEKETPRLNYIRINSKASLGLYGSHTFFRERNAISQNTRYMFKNTSSNALIWDVTTPINIDQMVTSKDGNNLYFTIKENQQREYVILNPGATFDKPEVCGLVPNQNLHGIEKATLVIISPPALKTQAEVIANIHRIRENMDVEVVTPEAIYNEFSSGTPDATAYRWFLRMLQKRTRGGNYLFLYGDGIYDNRLLTSIAKNKFSSPFDMILTYQSSESINTGGAYVTDDYFGFLDDGEGTNLLAHTLNVGIGRIPISTVEEARSYNAKVLNYINNSNKGVWKNGITFMADDGDSNAHMRQSNNLAKYIENNYPEFTVTKILTDAYKRETTATGNTYPEAKKKFLNQIENGQLIINYTGHGSVINLTGEDMLNMNDIQNFTNENLALWITATCDFTRFDYKDVTAGEMLLLNKKSGAIATFSTNRVVDGNLNYGLNSRLLENLFQKKGGKRLRLGDVMKNTKIALSPQENKLNFALFGNPAMYLAYPEQEIKITSFKNKTTGTSSKDTISALETVTIKGHIKGIETSLDEQFNGNLIATVFDCEEEVTTLRNNGEATPFIFNERTKILYSGNCNVVNGEFTLTFMVPKDNSYSYKQGYINFYAHDDNNNIEAQGYYNNFVIGGTDGSAPVDTEGPQMSVFLNSTNFRSGSKVNETPLLIVYANDESGINQSGTGLGHDITLIIDDNVSKPIILNSYFRNEGERNSGVIRYKMEELKEGQHTLYVKMWDIQNNSSTVKLDFEVVKGLASNLFNIYTIDDNKNGATTFCVEHDRPMAGVTVTIEAFDLTGRKVWTSQESTNSSDQLYTYTWNRTSNEGQELMPGLYAYRISVRCENSENATKSGKLLLVKQ